MPYDLILANAATPNGGGIMAAKIVAIGLPLVLLALVIALFGEMAAMQGVAM